VTVSAVAALAAEPAGARDARAKPEPSSKQIVAAVRAAAVKDAEAHPKRKDSPLWGQFPAKGSAGVHAFEGTVGRVSVSVSSSDDAAVEWYYSWPQESGYPRDEAYTTEKDWSHIAKQGGTLVFGTSDNPATTDDTGYYRACVTNALGRACSDPMKVIIQSRSEDGWWGPIDPGKDNFGTCTPSDDSFAQKVLIGIEGMDPIQISDDGSTAIATTDPTPRLQCGYLVDPATREIAKPTGDASIVDMEGARAPWGRLSDADYGCPSDRPFIVALAYYSEWEQIGDQRRLPDGAREGKGRLRCLALSTGAGQVTVDQSSYGERNPERVVGKQSCQPGGGTGGPPLPTSIAVTGLTWGIEHRYIFVNTVAANRLTCATVQFPAYQ
jgi:hypothetical protein